eukprot:GHRR01030668.1.p1 GENE.GHRR01030668.1~~GHRR01030668.1.p1  ORF type:complete len:105 (-),score=25.71 GHRR01030668.1:9-323(-)
MQPQERCQCHQYSICAGPTSIKHELGVLAQVPPVAGQAANNSSNSAPSSFTRVLIYALKPDVLAQLCDVEQGRNILRDLAHLYHYYLHGAQGNNGRYDPALSTY